MTHSGRDDLVHEIQRLQGLLDEVQGRLSSMPDEPSGEEAVRDPLLQARLDDAYAQLEIAKRVPAADAWQAIQKANAAVRPFEHRRSARPEPRTYSEPALRLTLFASASAPSLRALRAVDEVVRRLGDRALSLEVCDVARSPDRAERAGVVFTPVLRIDRAGRAPLTIFGALDDPDKLLARLARAGLNLDEDGTAPAEGAPAAPSLSAEGPKADKG